MSFNLASASFDHCAEFNHIKTSFVIAHSFLHEKYFAGRIELNQKGNQSKQRQTNYQKNHRYKNINQPLKLGAPAKQRCALQR